MNLQPKSKVELSEVKIHGKCFSGIMKSALNNDSKVGKSWGLGIKGKKKYLVKVGRGRLVPDKIGSTGGWRHVQCRSFKSFLLYPKNH